MKKFLKLGKAQLVVCGYKIAAKMKRRALDVATEFHLKHGSEPEIANVVSNAKDALRLVTELLLLACCDGKHFKAASLIIRKDPKVSFSRRIDHAIAITVIQRRSKA